MTKHWIGAARRAATEDFTRASEEIGCPVEALRAVWQVEAAGKPFRADGSLERRFEHKLAVPVGTWRTSLALSSAERERHRLRPEPGGRHARDQLGRAADHGLQLRGRGLRHGR